MSAVSGLLSVANANTNDLVGEYQESILIRNAKGFNAGTTLFGLLAKLKTEPAENTDFNWFERDPVRRELYAAGTLAAPGSANLAAQSLVLSETTGSVGNAYPYLAAGHVLRNMRTGEYFLVTTDPTTNTVVVTRALNATAAQITAASFTVALNDVIVIVTMAKYEGANPVRASYEEPSILTNYIQTFNSTVELTNAFKNNKLRSDQEGPLRDRRVQALEKIAKDIEMSLFLGSKRKDTTSGSTIYMTGGIKDAVDSGAPLNALDGNGAAGVDLQTFTDWLSTFMTSGSDVKLAFGGPKSYSLISNFANQAVNGFRIMQQESVFGMNITAINTPFGELDLAMHPLFKEITSMTDSLYVVDLPHLIQKTMEPLFLEPNIQIPGQDSYKEQYRAKLGLKLTFAGAFGYAQNLQKLL